MASEKDTCQQQELECLPKGDIPDTKYLWHGAVPKPAEYHDNNGDQHLPDDVTHDLADYIFIHFQLSFSQGNPLSYSQFDDSTLA